MVTTILGTQVARYTLLIVVLEGFRMGRFGAVGMLFVVTALFVGCTSQRRHRSKPPASLRIATAALPAGEVGVAYSATQLTATGGTPPYTWADVNSTLNSYGLTLDQSTGEITGTPTKATPASGDTVTIQVTDANNKTAQKDFTLVIYDRLQITTTALPAGYEGQTGYSATLAATGGTGSYTWSILSGSLPPFLNFDSSGLISGDLASNASTNSPYSLTIQVTDGQQTAQAALSITIYEKLQITTAALPDAYDGQTGYSATLAATGGTGSCTWSVVSGSLPPNLALDSSTGLISGDITSSASSNSPYNFTVEVTDGQQTAQAALSISVYAQLQITTTSLPEGEVGVAYSATQLAAAGGRTPCTWADVNNTLQNYGLTLDPGTGEITGTPTQATASGGATVTIEVTDANSKTAQKDFTLVIYPELQITTTSLDDATEGVAYSYTVTASGGNPANYTWSVSGQPSWLAIDAATGELNGRPPSSSARKYTFTVSVTDGIGAVQTDFTLTVNSSSFQITTSSLPDGVEGASYSATLTATGGTTPYTWSCVGGDLGAIGLSLDSSTGEITGTLSAGTAGKTHAFTFEVEDNKGASVTKDLEIAVYAPLEIVTSSLQDGVVNKAYSATLQATGGKMPYSWSEVTNDPDGDGCDLVDFNLTLNADGTITGTPSKAGQVTFRAKVVDSANPQQSATRDLTIKIRAWTIEMIDSNGNVGRYCCAVIDSDDHIHVAYQDVDKLALKYAYYDGANWRTETVYPTGDTGYYPRIAVDSNNTPHIVWYDKSNENVMYAFWNAATARWEDKGFLPAGCTDNANLAIVLDSHDNPHLFYVSSGNNRDLVHAYYDGTNWQSEIVYTAPQGKNGGPGGWFKWTVTATIDSNDTAWVAGTYFWKSTALSPPKEGLRFKIWKADLSSSWTWTEEATLETYGGGYDTRIGSRYFGKFAKFAFRGGSSSPFVIAWYRDTSSNDEIKIYGDSGGGYSSLYTVQSNVGETSFGRLVFDSSGAMHTAWFNGNDRKVQYATKQGISWSYDEIVDSLDVDGVDMVTDGSDRLYVIFYDATNGCLKIATKQ
ncbi:MAG: hypothetical protein DRP63_01900 [Planctomycetota bacterium]|nr:MAG: hypothetical protein DRP63_01900 [Planctomycetota bacterium]